MAEDEDKASFIEITWQDGTSARWVVTDRAASIAATKIERFLGMPDTLRT